MLLTPGLVDLIDTVFQSRGMDVPKSIYGDAYTALKNLPASASQEEVIRALEGVLLPYCGAPNQQSAEKRGDVSPVIPQCDVMAQLRA